MSEVIDKHSRMPRKFVSGEVQPKSDTGQFLAIPEDKKALVIQGLSQALLTGDTLESYAAKHEISPRTLNYWCAQLGEEYREIRKRWLDTKLTGAEEMMETASDPFKLAKGRELARLAMWYAERRDPERYSEKREITHKTDEPQTPEAIKERIAMLEGKLGVRVIEQEKQAA